MEHVPLPLEAWTNFYVIVGAAAGGLTGLTFVVIALVADAHSVRLTGLRAFITPTIVHFSSVLGLSALLNIPGQNSLSVGICLGVLGLWGVIYSVNTALHVKRVGSADYKPVASDWICNVLVPIGSYLALLVAGLLAPAHVVLALYATGGATLVLLFIGIRNAWDIAIWFTAERPSAQHDPSKTPIPTGPPAK